MASADQLRLASSSVQQAVAERNRIITEAHNKHANLERELTQAKQSVDSTSQQTNSFLIAINRLNEQPNDPGTQASLAVQTKALQEARQEKKESEDRVRELERQLADLDNAIRDLTTDLAQIQQQVSMLDQLAARAENLERPVLS